MKDILRQYKNYDVLLIYFMYYLAEQYFFYNRTKINFEFKNLTVKLGTTRYKLKKYIDRLDTDNFLTYKNEGGKYNKKNIIILNTNNDALKILMQIIKDENNTTNFFNRIKNFITNIKTKISNLSNYFSKIMLIIVILTKLKVINLLNYTLNIFKLKFCKTCIYISNKFFNNKVQVINNNNIYKLYKYIKKLLINKNNINNKELMNNNGIKRSNKVLKNKMGEKTNMGLKPIKLVSMKKSKRQKLESDMILMFPFKLDGNKQIREFGIQKIMKARGGLISWEKVTNRDLASYLVYVSENKSEAPLEFHNWQYPRIKKIINKILNIDDIKKEDWCRVCYYLVECYKENFSDNQYKGLNWSFLENSYFREELLKNVKEKLIYYNEKVKEIRKTSNEEIKELQNSLDLSQKLAEVQYYINKGYAFNNPIEKYELKEWNDLCRKLEKEDGLIEITVGDERREEKLINDR